VVNTFRSLKGREPLLSSPGKQFFEYGIRRDGWWNYEKFSDQTVAICDVVEALWPHEQLAFEVDHSSGHTKTKANGLQVNEMNKLYGGNQRIMRDTVIVQGCLGPEEQRGIFREGERCLQIGDIQHMCFQDGDLPPFYDLSINSYDRLQAEMTPAEIKQATNMMYAADRKRSKKIEQIRKKGIPSLTAAAELAPQVDTTMIKKGYVGMAKGIQQILWERGLWVKDMKISKTEGELKLLKIQHKVVPDNNLSADYILGACPDFMGEKSALSELVESRGHKIFAFSKMPSRDGRMWY
jgi:hypothetical protein